jgi:hypothetical protein
MVSWAPLKLCPVAPPLRRGFCCIWRLAPGTCWLPRVLWNMAYLMPDDLLVKCTQCDAWPMHQGFLTATIDVAGGQKTELRSLLCRPRRTRSLRKIAPDGMAS